MKVVFPAKVEPKKLQVGDVVEVGTSPYLIVKNLFQGHNENTYSAIGFDGSTASTGEHFSLELLQKSLDSLSCGYTHYPKGQFELNLVTK